jgi:hypothetical protein
MMLRFVLSKLVQIILRLWGVEATASLGRSDSTREFPRNTTRQVRIGNGDKVSIASSSVPSRE